MKTIRAGVVDEHEIFRRGIVACLLEDPLITIVVAASSPPVKIELDVAVVSPLAAALKIPSPLIICGTKLSVLAVHEENQVAGVLPRSTLEAEQLVASVRAVATGLRIGDDPSVPVAQALDGRRIEILRLLSEGASTNQMARALRYSERTIKQLIYDIERNLEVRTRAQAVAEGIRRGLI